MSDKIETLIRRRKISLLTGSKTPESCGYFDRLILWETPKDHSRTLKEILGAFDVSTLNGIPIDALVKEHVDESLIFYDVPDVSREPPEYPLHYKVNFFGSLDIFMKIFKGEFRNRFLYLLKKTSDINKFRAHSDEIDCIKIIIMHSYETALCKVPGLRNNKMVQKLKFFKETFKVFDRITRYIKSFIFSGEYKKQSKNMGMFVDAVLNNLFGNVLGHQWIIYDESKIPEPLKVDNCDLYKEDIIKVTVDKRDFLFRSEKMYEIGEPKFKKDINILDMIKRDKNCWFYIESLKKRIKEGDDKIIILFLPELKISTIVKKDEIEKDDKSIKVPIIVNGLGVPGWVIRYFQNKLLLEMAVITKMIEIEHVDSENTKWIETKLKCDGSIKTIDGVKLEGFEDDKVIFLIFYKI